MTLPKVNNNNMSYNPIKAIIDGNVSSEKQRQEDVMKISRTIEGIINIPPEEWPHGFTYRVGDYQIVKEHRCFTPWVEVYEIRKADGYCWANNQGTTGINIPPVSVQQKVFADLNKLYRK